ncbi:MAG: aminoglycoside phosphotransferase family protein [Actinobacteria bacterium]|nr:aminoglycoside phosphotransferase family protein [Actinomycetota bacterium]
MSGAEAAAQVRATVEAALPCWYGPGSRLLSLSIPRPYAWSHQFEAGAATASGGRRLVVKIPRWEEAPTLEAALAAGPQEGTRREYAALEAMAAAVAAAADPGLAAVAPVAYLAEINAVVTERLEAVPLASRLGRHPGSAGRGMVLLRRAGRALRLYHEAVAGAAPGRFDGAWRAAELEARARRSMGAALLPAEAWARLAQEARRRDGTPVAVGATHGDFSPANVLVTADDRVALLDPNLVPGPLLEDAAKLLAALRTRRAIVLTRGRWGEPRLRAQEQAFLEGYRPGDSGLLGFFQAVATAQRAVEMEERLARWPAPARAAAAALLRGYPAAEVRRLLP